jgi:DNA-directed RNA polymerase I subunit RPA1
MAATGGRAVPTSASVSALHWGVYTDEEIDSLAVLSVTNPALVDALQRPQPGGLYDPAMGPLDAHSRCATCRLQHAFCPGHCGKH